MRIGIKTLGCPKNEADCAVLRAILEQRSHEIVEDIEEAEAVILDTCGFIEEAKKESISEILDFIEHKKRRKSLLFVKGCLVQRYFEDLTREIHEVDGWFGVVPPERIADAVEKGEKKVIYCHPESIYNSSVRFDSGPYAYIKIADGCSHTCSFCAIPAFKGPYKSRRMNSVILEAEQLVRNGVLEIILVAQDTSAYGTDTNEGTLCDLLKRLDSIDGTFWIRVMYLHPDHITPQLIDTMTTCKKVLPYFDIPIQHGSDRILEKMGRQKRSKQILDILYQIRSVQPDSVIRTSVIVGFPDESRSDFETLLEFLREAQFDRLGCFVYSDEEGTPARSFFPKIPRNTALARQEELMLLQREISRKRMSRWTGKTIEVLVEEREDGCYTARSFMDAPEVDGNVFVQSRNPLIVPGFYHVNITTSLDYDLEGVAL